MLQIIVGIVIIVTCYLFLTTKKNESKEVAATVNFVNNAFFVLFVILGLVIFSIIVSMLVL